MIFTITMIITITQDKTKYSGSVKNSYRHKQDIVLYYNQEL